MDLPNPEPEHVGSSAGPVPQVNVPESIMTHLGDSLERERATEIAPGVTLFTKDGAVIGNAIVVREVGQTRVWRNDPASAGIPLDSPDAVTLEPVWQVETDFGNRLQPTTREIFTMWDLGYVQDYDQWWDDRLDIIKKSVEP
jgi:hypothetical protein